MEMKVLEVQGLGLRAGGTFVRRCKMGIAGVTIMMKMLS